MSKKRHKVLKIETEEESLHPYEVGYREPQEQDIIPLSVQEYNDLLSQLYSPGHWFQCSYDSFQVMNLEEAVLWNFLLNQDRKTRQKKPQYNGWFHCSLKYLEEKFPTLGERKQQRILKKLKDKKFVKVRMSGIPAKRYFQLNLELFRNEVLLATTEVGSPDKIVGSSTDGEGRANVSILRIDTKENNSRTRRTPSGRSSGPAGGNQMNLFGAYDDNTPQKDQRASPEVKVAVNTLRQFAARNSWPVSRSPKNWEVPLMTLAKQVGHDKVLRAVDWYVKNHPDNMRMRLVDGKEFREHYMKVVRRMEGVEVVKVEVEEVLSATVAELKGLGWPKGSKKDVGAACQLTLLAVRGFREKLGRWYDGQPNKDTPHARLALWLLEGGMPESNVNFVEVWMERVWKRIRDWEDWNGNLLREVPQPGPTDKRWNEWGREVTGEYCEDPRRWDKLMGYVYSR